MTVRSLMPRQAVPALDLPLLAGGRFVLGETPPSSFDLLVFYRGLHCPLCARYLAELERLSPEFAKRGVRLTAISADAADRARAMADKIGASGLQVAHGLDMPSARAWGLYISTSRGQTSLGIEEPPLFAEPAVYLVRPDGTLYYGAVQTMPFARPAFNDLLAAIDFALDKHYPARGEYTGPV
jgi:peroxiredoxin